MATPAAANLVLIETKLVDGTFRLGTGYLVSPDRALTARHVLIGASEDESSAEQVQVFQDSNKKWVSASTTPLWERTGVDAVVLALDEPFGDIAAVEFGVTTDLEENKNWVSTGYPGVVAQPDHASGLSNFPTSGLSGLWYTQGGGGQLAGGVGRYLELGVEYAADNWQGVSGAPVFVDDRLVGIVASAWTTFNNERIQGVPIEHIVQDPEYLAAMTPVRRTVPEAQPWYLVVKAAGTSANMAGLIESGLKAFEGERQNLEPTEYNSVEVPQIIVEITEELSSPGRWLSFIELVAKAPVMVVDLAIDEPAIMMALGIRAVARRGVTVPVSRSNLRESELRNLPFNVKETRVVSLATSEGGTDNLIRAIRRGLREAGSPDYLDLPAYEYVRGPPPSDQAELLMLCPFDDRFEPHLGVLLETVSRKLTGYKGVRLLDIDSPRLAGQALYEQIRWNRHCLVDWTAWRPNVFFELGVRLACCEFDPIMVIHETGTFPDDAPAPPDESASQRERLLQLFDTCEYSLPAEDGGDVDNPQLDAAFDRHNAILGQQTVDVQATTVPLGATHRILATAYDWQQERLDVLPDEYLQQQIEARFTSDSQRRVTESTVLFATNREFLKKLQERVREDWLAAWFYALGRFDLDSPDTRAKLIDLGENARQALRGSDSPFHLTMRDRIRQKINELEQM